MIPARLRPAMRVNTKCGWCGIDGYQKYGMILPDGELVIRCSGCVDIEDFNVCNDCGLRHYYVDYRKLGDKSVYHKWPRLRELCRNCGDKYRRNTPPLKIKECDRCRDVIQDNRKKLCNHCDEHFSLCPTCNAHYVRKDWDVIAFNNDTDRFEDVPRECAECLTDKYSKCKVCGIHLVGPYDDICNECTANLIECDLCGEVALKKYYKRIDNKTICPACVNNRVATCRICGQTKVDVGKEYHHHKGNNENGCRDCIGSPILRYNFKPKPKFFGQGVLYYGIENEYDFTEHTYRRYTDRLRKMYAQDDLRYFVHDGSLRHGVEMVFHPQTFDHIMLLQEPLPTDVTNHVGTTAGLHIHMSKDAFTTFHLYKFLNFITMNADKAFHPIFQRKIGHTSPVNGKIYCEPFPLTVKQIARGRTGDKKYWWINLSNPHTIEIRLFKAAKNSTELRAVIQFLDSLYYYTKDTAVNDLSLDQYFKFMRSEKHYEDVYQVFHKEVM